jgi:hypothetical protein
MDTIEGISLGRTDEEILLRYETGALVGAGAGILIGKVVQIAGRALTGELPLPSPARLTASVRQYLDAQILHAREIVRGLRPGPLTRPPTAPATPPADQLLPQGGRQLEFDFTSALGPRPAPRYPENFGFLGDPSRATLVPGARVARFGPDAGRFVAPAGTPFGARSLPSSSARDDYSVFEVLKPIGVDAGVAAPWFGMPGLGMQYYLDAPVSQLIENGSLRPVLRVSP